MKHLTAAIAVCLALVGPAAPAQEAAAPPGADPIAEQVLAPELIMKHQKAIALTEAQKAAVIAEVKRVQGRLVDVQWDMQRAAEPLVELLSQEKLDEAQVLAQLDKVLAVEREFKRAQLSLAVRLKNILAPEQRRKLGELRAVQARPGDPPRAGAPR